MPAGTVRVVWNGAKIKKATRDGVEHGLQLSAEHLLGQSRQEAPLREGHLDRSGRAEVFPNSLTAAVSFNTPYARRQHEETSWRHPVRGKAHYLSDPFTREQETMLALIATATRRSLR